LIGIQGARTFGAPAARARATRTHTAVKIVRRVLDGLENGGFAGVGIGSPWWRPFIGYPDVRSAAVVAESGRMLTSGAVDPPGG
jgi:hypothetical protein